jgi:hypothetical protein
MVLIETVHGRRHGGVSSIGGAFWQRFDGDRRLGSGRAIVFATASPQSAR